MLTLASLVLLVSPQAALAQDLRLPAVLGDHAVLQRGATVRVFGHAHPRAEVRASASWGHEASSRADDGGAFELRLQPAEQAGPHALTVSAGAGTRTLRDLWFGDVWLCGGQSNMEWTLGPGVGPGIADWQREVAGADDAQLRVFDVPNVSSPVPRDACGGEWQVCTADAARRFSAIGYLFGRELRAELGVPIGLIVSCWGGTPAEAWTPEGSLRELGEFAAGLATVHAARAEPAEQSLGSKQAAWFQQLRSTDPGERSGYMLVAHDDTEWPTTPVPGTWTGELGTWDGVVWLRRTIELPAAWAGRALELSLGPIDDLDTVWVDGMRVGGTEAGNPAGTPRRYQVPAAAARAGKTVVALRVVDVGGAGGLVGGAGDLWLALAGDGGERQSLAGAWRMQKGASLRDLGDWPRQDGLSPHLPSVLWNGMIAPLARCALRGVIFYQGEANVGAPQLYRALFPALIGGWRETFADADLPFYYVQIAPYTYRGRSAGRAAFLREAQALAMEQCQHVGMAVTMDIGDPADIHPRNKQDVARRLALWALSATYGRTDRDPHGPALAGHAVEGDAIRVRLQYAEGLRTTDGAAPSCFTIAGEDRVFHAAEATIAADGSVLVRSARVSQPIAVRYAFGDADMTNLVNGKGLPAASFRTDDWPPP